jgi:hypothetical protein
MEPAQTIIRNLGGAPAVARITGVHRTRVYSWTWPKSAGGTGGTIPFNHVPALIEAARTKGVELSADDFLPAPSPQEKVAS